MTVRNKTAVGLPSIQGNSQIIETFKYLIASEPTIGSFVTLSASNTVADAGAGGEHIGIATVNKKEINEFDGHVDIIRQGIGVEVPFVGVFALNDPVTIGATGLVDKAGLNATNWVVTDAVEVQTLSFDSNGKTIEVTTIQISNVL